MSSLSFGQVKDRSFNLADAPYSLTTSDFNTKVSDRYATGKDTLALPYAWAVAKGAYKLTYAQFRSRYLFTAVFTDAAWWGEDVNNMKNGYMNTYNFIEIPAGKYQSNLNCTLPRGGVKGQGSFANDYPYYGKHSTEVDMDDATWIDTDPTWHERILFQTANWNLENNYSYNESFTVEKLCLNGPYINDGKTRIGLALGRAGECSYVNQIFSSAFSYGFVARGGVPLTMGTNSAFLNFIAGISFRGSALATFNIHTFSGDSNGSLVLVEEGYGAPAGAILNVNLLKAEDGIAVNDNGTERGASQGQIVVYANGLFSININNFNASCVNIMSNSVFVVNGNLNNGTSNMQASSLRVGGEILGYENILVDLATHKRYKTPYGGSARVPTTGEFRYYTKPARFLSDLSDLSTQDVFPTSKPIGFLRIDPNTGGPIGSFDYVNGLPIKPGVGVIPSNLCTSFKYSVTSTCTDGSWKTRTAVGLPNGCIGTAPADSLSRDCKVIIIPCAWTYTWPTNWGPCINGYQSQTQIATSTGDCSLSPAAPESRTQPCTVIPPTGNIPSRSVWEAKASSTYAPWPVSNAIDNDLNSKWSNGQPQAVGDWIYVDMKSAANITQVTFDQADHGFDYSLGYKIQISLDGVKWSDIASGVGKTNQPMVANWNGSARYVRLYITKARAQYWLTVGDIQIK